MGITAELSIGSFVNLNGKEYVLIGWNDRGGAIVAGNCRAGMPGSYSLPYLGVPMTIDPSKLRAIDRPSVKPDELNNMIKRRNDIELK